MLYYEFAAPIREEPAQVAASGPPDSFPDSLIYDVDELELDCSLMSGILGMFDGVLGGENSWEEEELGFMPNSDEERGSCNWKPSVEGVFQFDELMAVQDGITLMSSS